MSASAATATVERTSSGTSSSSPSVDRTATETREPVPAPRVRPALRRGTLAATGALGAVAGAGPALALFRLSSVGGLSNCGGSPRELSEIDDIGIDANPLTLSIGGAGLPNHMGALVGNAALIVAVLLCLRVVAEGIARCTAVSIDAALAMVRHPGIVADLVYAIGPPTVTAIATTAAFAPVTSSLLIMWVIGGCVFLILPLYVFATVLPVASRTCRILPVRKNRSDPTGYTTCAALTRFANYVFAPWSQNCQFLRMMLLPSTLAPTSLRAWLSRAPPVLLLSRTALSLMLSLPNGSLRGSCTNSSPHIQPSRLIEGRPVTAR